MGRAFAYTEGNNILAPTSKVLQTTQTHHVQNQTQVALPASRPRASPLTPSSRGAQHRTPPDPTLSLLRATRFHRLCLPGPSRVDTTRGSEARLHPLPGRPLQADDTDSPSDGPRSGSTQGAAGGRQARADARRTASLGLRSAQPAGPGSLAQQSCGRPHLSGTEDPGSRGAQPEPGPQLSSELPQGESFVPCLDPQSPRTPSRTRAAAARGKPSLHKAGVRAPIFKSRKSQ